MTKIGNKVRVRRCKDLLCEFVEPHDEVGIIDIGHGFIESMYNYCGEEATIDDFEESVFFFKRYLDLLEKIKEINSPHAYLLFRYIMKRIAKCRPKTTHMEDIISECERQNVNPITFIKFVMP